MVYNLSPESYKVVFPVEETSCSPYYRYRFSRIEFGIVKKHDMVIRNKPAEMRNFQYAIPKGAFFAHRYNKLQIPGMVVKEQHWNLNPPDGWLLGFSPNLETHILCFFPILKRGEVVIRYIPPTEENEKKYDWHEQDHEQLGSNIQVRRSVECNEILVSRLPVNATKHGSDPFALTLNIDDSKMLSMREIDAFLLRSTIKKPTTPLFELQHDIIGNLFYFRRPYNPQPSLKLQAKTIP